MGNRGGASWVHRSDQREVAIFPAWRFWGSYDPWVHLSWPLIGRTEEMRAIKAAISAPAVSGVLICGAEGVGKSRIAREGLSAAASQGCETRLTAGTSSAREIPLGAFTAWAPSGVTDTVQLLQGVIESQTAATSSAAKVVLGVDDVHLLDDLSTFVVHQIVQRGAAKAILTVRDGEPIPPAIQEIWKTGQFDRLDLQQLSLDETTALLSATLEGSVDSEAAQRLWKLTRGNVLYLRNIVEQEVADGRIVEESGRWRWMGDPIMPPGLVELIESRIGDLAAPTPIYSSGRRTALSGWGTWPWRIDSRKRQATSERGRNRSSFVRTHCPG